MPLFPATELPAGCHFPRVIICAWLFLSCLYFFLLHLAFWAGVLNMKLICPFLSLFSWTNTPVKPKSSKCYNDMLIFQRSEMVRPYKSLRKTVPEPPAHWRSGASRRSGEAEPPSDAAMQCPSFGFTPRRGWGSSSLSEPVNSDG